MNSIVKKLFLYLLFITFSFGYSQNQKENDSLKKSSETKKRIKQRENQIEKFRAERKEKIEKLKVEKKQRVKKKKTERIFFVEDMDSIPMTVINENYSNQEMSKELDESKFYGLISYLSFLKNSAENDLAFKNQSYLEIKKMVSDSSTTIDVLETSKSDLLTAQSKYYKLKVLSDRLINQLTANMIDKNSMGTYRRLNKGIKGISTNFDFYVLIKEIDDAFLLLINPKLLLADLDIFDTYVSTNKFFDLKFEAGDVLTGVGLVNTVVKDIREARSAKVSNMIKLLSGFQLASVKEIIKPEKKK